MSSRLKFFLLSALILCAALWIRVINLYSIPLFIDEGIHLDWRIAGRSTLRNIRS
ncbi:MAG: hypothetical protein HZB17_00675 [Chloroflexi bacterium]|nr:hypothetical protein [Chloroflexota bacterium]